MGNRAMHKQAGPLDWPGDLVDWGKGKLFGGTAARPFGAEDSGKFYDKLERNTGISQSDWVNRLSPIREVYGDAAPGGGNASSNPILRPLQPGQENRWDKMKAFYEAVPEMTRSPDQARKVMEWQNQLSSGLNRSGRELTRQIAGQTPYRKTDDGYQLDTQGLMDTANRWRKAVRESDMSNEEFQNLLNQAGKVVSSYGEPGQRLVRQVLQRGEGGDPAENLKRMQQYVPQMEQLNRRLQEFDIQGEDVASQLQDRMGDDGSGETVTPDRLEDLNQRLGQLTDLSETFGPEVKKKIRKQLEDRLSSGEWEGSGETSRMMNEALELQDTAEEMGIGPEQMQGLASYFQADEGGELDSEQIGQWGDMLQSISDTGVDVDHMLEVDEDGNPSFTDVLEMLPESNDTRDPMELFNRRYRQDDGSVDQDRLTKDMKGLDRVYDELSMLSESSDMVNEYADKIGMDDPSKLVSRYQNKNGEIDFKSMEKEVGFWAKTMQMLKEDPDMKEQFDRVTDFGADVKGIGILDTARDKIIDWAPSLFSDSEGNLRKNTMSAALTVADWGQWTYKKLFEEKNPIAWAGAVAVSIPILKGLWNLFSGVIGGGADMIGGLFGGGRRPQQPQGPQYPEGGYYQPMMQAPQSGLGRQGGQSMQMLGQSGHPRHYTTRELVEGPMR